MHAAGSDYWHHVWHDVDPKRIVSGALITKRVAATALTVIATQLMLAGATADGATSHEGQSSPAVVAFDRINAIRAEHGLAPGRFTTAFDSEARAGLLANGDPPFAPPKVNILSEDALWGALPGLSGDAASSATVLVNAWVYHDGWRGSAAATWNADCTSEGAPGCNGHRRAILSSPPVRGARLFIDVATSSVNYGGGPATALAALLVWEEGSGTATAP